MTISAEQFATANKASVDALLSLANSALACVSNIFALNLNAAHLMLDSGAANTVTILGAKDAQEALDVSKAQVQRTLAQVVDYSRTLYDISEQSKYDVSEQLEIQLADFQQHISELMEKTVKNAPAGSDFAVTAVKLAIEAANSAFVKMQHVIEHASGMTEAHRVKTSSAVIDAATQSAGKE